MACHDNCFFAVEIPLYRRIYHPCLGIFRLAVLASVFLYWLMFPMFSSSMYQKHYPLRSVISNIKLQGVVDNTDLNITLLPKQFRNNSQVYKKIFNVEDCLIPYQGIGPSEGIFVVTNLAVTNNKTIHMCPEDPVIGKCIEDTDCSNRTNPTSYNGELTGRCVPSDIEERENTCEIHGWCPVTRRTQPLKSGKAILEKVKDMTITVHSLETFENTNIFIHNIQQVKDELNGSALAGCIHVPGHEVMRLCPRFRIYDAVMQAEGTRPNETFSSIALRGAVVSIRIKYDCNFDWYPVEKCQPTYSLHRQDNILTNDGAGELQGISQSLSATNYHDADRKTVAVYDGIRFLVDVEGRARQTDKKYVWICLGLLFSWIIVVTRLMPHVQNAVLSLFSFLKNLAGNCDFNEIRFLSWASIRQMLTGYSDSYEDLEANNENISLV